MRLQDKRVIITGGSTGIGAAVARRFLDEGAKVAVWCRNPDNATAIARGAARTSPMWPRSTSPMPTGVDRAFAQSLERLGGLDVLICNAGISIRRSFVDIAARGIRPRDARQCAWRLLREPARGAPHAGSRTRAAPS